MQRYMRNLKCILDLIDDQETGQNHNLDGFDPDRNKYI